MFLMPTITKTTKLWKSLSKPWRVCVDEAWKAYCSGSLPIGAALTDKAGNILARGHNLRLSKNQEAHALAGSSVAHAEIITLGSVHSSISLNKFILFSTMEPCPMCTGAIRMSGVGEVHYASKDPFAGGIALLETSSFMRQHKCNVISPSSEMLEILLLALLVSRLMQSGFSQIQIALNIYEEYSPHGVAFARWLTQKQILPQLVKTQINSEAMLDCLEHLFIQQQKVNS
jgi:tRNA(adenine34) deaminase